MGNLMNRKIIEVIAENYLSDARDFQYRFDKLWESELHKTGRIKSFVDLLMAFECILKCHAVLSHASNNPEEVYTSVRRCGHNIARLCEMPHFLKGNRIYQTVSEDLGKFSVNIRYLLDAEALLIPLIEDWKNAPINYDQTIGNHSWVMTLRKRLDTLIAPANEKFNGLCEDSIKDILEIGVQMEKIYKKLRT